MVSQVFEKSNNKESLIFNAELDSPNRTDQTLGAKMRLVCIEAKSRLDLMKQSQEREMRPDLFRPNIASCEGLTPRSGSESARHLMERSGTKRPKMDPADEYASVTTAQPRRKRSDRARSRQSSERSYDLPAQITATNRVFNLPVMPISEHKSEISHTNPMELTQS